MDLLKKHIPILTVATLAMAFLMFPRNAAAQYFSLGDDPGSTKWMQLETPNYDVIYPVGTDSLAYDYAFNLERYRPLSLWGISTTGKRMPVILHPYNATANGMVMWAPKRMELLTTPDGYAPSAVPWSRHLAMHESRHIGHINNFTGSVFRPFTWIFGQQASGLFFGLYQNTFMYEGDAVVTETVLSEGGRGREAKFLSYYAAAFDNGDFRNRDRWIVGSYRHYTPDNYAYGYLLGSYIIYLTEDYGYYGKILETIRKRPYIPWVNNYAYKKITGKTKRELHDEAVRLYSETWEQAAAHRPPVTPRRMVAEAPRRYTEYSGGTMGHDGRLYYIKHSLHEPYTLIAMDTTGKERKIIPFSYNTSCLASNPEGSVLYWTETVSDERWSLRESSDIFSYDLKEKRKKRITKGGRFWNVAVSDDGKYLAATEYAIDGKYFLVIMDASCGKTVKRLPLPPRTRFTENAWRGEEIYSLGITDGGMGIWKISFSGEKISAGEENSVPDSSGFSVFLPVEPVNLAEIGVYDGMITYVSDRDGIDNLYGTDVHTGKTSYLLSTPYGMDSYIIDGETGKMYSSQLGTLGYLPYISDIDKSRPAGDTIYRNPITERITGIAMKQIPDSLFNIVPDSSSFRKKRYRKTWHLFNIHSWSPFYFDTDNLRSLSFDAINETGSLGAVVWSQNHLGTAEAMLGYFYKGGRHGGAFRFSYTGLYPVFELDVNFNSRSFIRNHIDFANMETSSAMAGSPRKDPSLQIALSAYVPFTFNYGGWSKGLVPQISAGFTNDRYKITVPLPFGTMTEEHSYLVTLTASLRYYQMRQTPVAAVYPEYGFGAEAGFIGAGNMRKYIGDRLYAYIYGYLPGIANQGIKLSALHARDIQSRPLSLGGLSLAPRGLTGNAGTLFNPSCGTLATADYAAPVYLGDISIPGILYLKRAVLNPFFDIAFDHSGKAAGGNGTGKRIPARECFSAGADITFEVHIFNLPYSFTVGTRLAYNGGNALSSLPGTDRFYAGFLFGASFE